ncbi:MAG: head GIN domain-containing protein [Chitinophagaceae bacterium]
MKQILSLLLIAALPVFASAQKVITDPNAQVRAVGSFHAIKVSNAIDIYISQSDKEALAVSAAKDEFRDRIRASVENGVLTIWYDNDSKNWNSNKKLKAYISVKTLDKITASGASDVYVEGTLKGGDLAFDLSGASDFKGAVEVTSLTSKMSGASDVTISGTAGVLTIDANGASDFKGYDLRVDKCSIEASGASDVKITVNKELNARVSGASDVNYRGDAVIRDIKTSGASSVSRKG